jgi:recombination protein RecR
MRLPKALEKLTENFEKLPGIGPKTAARLSFYLLRVPQVQLDDFSESLSDLKKNTLKCRECFLIGDLEICVICSDEKRDATTICIIEDPLDVVAIEKSGKYTGLYHVLHGVIDPLNNIGPDDIYIPQLISRLSNGHPIQEIILATNPTLEGEATCMYIVNKLNSKNLPSGNQLKITRIGRGLPIGADIEYADEVTLQRALEGRREY